MSNSLNIVRLLGLCKPSRALKHVKHCSVQQKRQGHLLTRRTVSQSRCSPSSSSPTSPPSSMLHFFLAGKTLDLCSDFWSLLFFTNWFRLTGQVTECFLALITGLMAIQVNMYGLQGNGDWKKWVITVSYLIYQETAEGMLLHFLCE